MSGGRPGEFDFAQQRRTFRLELLRSLPQGFVETAVTSYVIYVAIRDFELPSWMKATLIASTSLGLLLSLFVVQIVRRLGCTVNRMAAGLWTAAGACFATAALIPATASAFYAACCGALTFLGLAAPLMSQIYRKHYRDETRGRLFSFSSLARAGAAAAAGWAAGLWLDAGGFAPLFLAYGAGCLAMAACVRAMAPVRLRLSNRIRWFDAFRGAAANRPFRKLLGVWMILGIGNLMAMAFFVEYVGNPRYGFGYEADRVGLLTTTVPMLAFIVFVVPWGHVFDRLPFYRIRALVNVFFIAGILCYYFGSSFGALCTGIALHGVARSGGAILWTLWVTRFAEADRVLEFQSVHSFLTGVRGIFAPLIAFAAAETLGPQSVAIAASVLMAFATLLILPELRAESGGA